MNKFYNSFKSQFKGLEKIDMFFLFFGLFSIVLSSILSLTLATSGELTANDIIVSILSLIAAICAFLAMIALMNNSIWNFLWALTQSFVFIYAIVYWRTWGQLILILFVWLPADFYGLMSWRKKINKEKKHISQTNLSNRDRLSIFVIFLVVTVAIALVLSYETNDSAPWADTIVLTSGATALFLAINTKTSQWFYWSVTNIASIVLFGILIASEPSRLYEYIPQIVLRVIILTSLMVRLIMHDKDQTFFDYLYFSEQPDIRSHIDPIYAYDRLRGKRMKYKEKALE